jgi:hypothetical protein
MFRIPRYESPMLATPEIPTFLDRRELLTECQSGRRPVDQTQREFQWKQTMFRILQRTVDITTQPDRTEQAGQPTQRRTLCAARIVLTPPVKLRWQETGISGLELVQSPFHNHASEFPQVSLDIRFQVKSGLRRDLASLKPAN